jgi:DNA-binding MarR family transcriptional regulator
VPRGKQNDEPATVPAKAGIGFYLRQSYRAFSREFHARLARHDITHAQWVLMWFLSQAGTLTPLMLSRQAGIQKASATSVIESLKRRKLIRGDQDARDRRKMNLTLTPAGVHLMKQLIACAGATNTVAHTGLTNQEFETLFRLLQTVTANLERSADANGSPGSRQETVSSRPRP